MKRNSINAEKDIRVPFFQLSFFIVIPLVEKIHFIHKNGTSLTNELLIAWMIGAIIINVLLVRSYFFNQKPGKLQLYLVPITTLIGVYIILIPGIWGIVKTFQDYSHFILIRSLLAIFIGYKILYNHNRLIDIGLPKDI